MNQIAIDFTANAPRCVVPEPDTQCGALLRAMQSGRRLTVAIALTEYGCYALSQRCGELRKAGWPVQSRTITTPSGKRVSEYWVGQ